MVRLQYVIREDWSVASYPIYTVKTSDWHIDEIAGIKFLSGNRQAVVNFSIMRDNLTPFGLAIYKSNLIKKFQAYFTLYDDGWRVEAIGTAN